jgi:hypothetical protein
VNELLKDLGQFAEQAQRLLVGFAQWAYATAATAEREHHRRELLSAYQRRRFWKKADRPYLETLSVNSAAHRRMARVEGIGRPVVRPHQNLSALLIERLRVFKAIQDPNTPAHLRKRLLRQWPWWEHSVEALYRGEYAHARYSGIRRPSSAAEDAVGGALNMSSNAVRKICARIRAKRAEWEGGANFPPMRLHEFKRWMQTGSNPRLDHVSAEDVQNNTQ